MSNIYLDFNANYPIRDTARRALDEALSSGAGNPSSSHSRGLRARRFLEDARRVVAAGIGVRPSEIAFTSGGTESNNTALRGLLAHRAPLNLILVAATDHHSVIDTAKALSEGGAEVVVLPVDHNGILNFDFLERHLDERVALVAVMSANNETGVVQDIAKIANLASRFGVPVHTDAVQAVGKIAVDANGLGVQTASLTAHKFGGPIGIGALFVKKGTQLSPILTGGGQEHGWRSGTQAFALAHAMATALGDAVDELGEMADRVARLRDELVSQLRSSFPGAKLQGGDVARLPNSALVTFPGVDGPALMITLDQHGLCVGTGAACGTGKPSHVLTAMGAAAEEAHGTLRFSLSTQTTAADIQTACELVCTLSAGNK